MPIIWLGMLALDAQLGGCGDAAVQAEALAAIEAQNAAVESAFADGDMARYAQIFTEDAWQVSPGSAPLVGRAAIEASWSGLASMGDVAFDLNTLDVWVCEGSAIERGHGTLTFEPHAGAAEQMPGFSASANYIAHWIEEAPGVWRVRSDVAAAEPAPDAASGPH